MADTQAARLEPGANRQESGRTDSARGSRRGVFLVLGGTGMLLPAVRHLLREGEDVVVAARRASRALQGVTGSVTAIDADWSHPAHYAELCLEAVAGREVRGVLIWVHQPHRDAVTQAIEPVLSQATRVVRLWGSASGDPRAKARASYQPSVGDLCEVYLGSVAGPDGRSWLTHEQISQGALTALRGGCREHAVGDLSVA
ncbi:hypothetical protein [Buchananella hordeovulneris]|uniref:hypothetical protein n=1 Tax=Buchananella hordeovulneris TaxID=52770 RepID=UPI000F9B5637|nr:hypothetical protein [Buchananella hordeovulneris]RRD42029.1 hypothetical protein EII13_10450 [Buchananella hordeovulneris]